MSDRTPEPGSQAWFEQLIDKETSDAWKKMGDSFDEQMAELQDKKRTIHTGMDHPSPTYESLMRLMEQIKGPEMTVFCHPVQYSFVADAINSEFNTQEYTRIRVERSEFVKLGQVLVVNHRKMDRTMRGPITRLPTFFLNELPDE